MSRRKRDNRISTTGAALAPAMRLTKWLLLAGYKPEEIRARGCDVLTSIAEYETDTGHTCSERGCHAAIHRRAGFGPWPSRCSVHTAIHAKAKLREYRPRKFTEPVPCPDCPPDKPNLIQPPASGPMPSRCPSCTAEHNRAMGRKRSRAKAKNPGRATVAKWVADQVLTK